MHRSCQIIKCRCRLKVAKATATLAGAMIKTVCPKLWIKISTLIETAPARVQHQRQVLVTPKREPTSTLWTSLLFIHRSRLSHLPWEAPVWGEEGHAEKQASRA